MSEEEDKRFADLPQVEQLLEDFKALKILKEIEETQRNIDHEMQEYEQRHVEQLQSSQSELERLKAKEANVIEEYKIMLERDKQTKLGNESMEENIQQLDVQIAELQREKESLMKQVQALREEEFSPTNIPSTELTLALFEGLGVKPVMEDGQVKKLILGK
ncbi:hypothetical protein G6F70_004238 [Rhizopus microsporus]|nr:hypothetical protein G6F71_003606 [Rhizopus microsporus]KAG1200234.1 hypothetical protein G6F70_004238 [Rhizopus microsporus]KAG1211922.1 hypothetical protein G6F69_004181 [Rhizopus microsporus]KAG1233861.1 hypothetical protein G6F67_003983 [Rhizopus microsporus]KAG1263260.1 hypothetical protein G6F68_005269 [Rhizopus microsporus]